MAPNVGRYVAITVVADVFVDVVAAVVVLAVVCQNISHCTIGLLFFE